MAEMRNYSTSLTRLLKGLWHMPAVLDTQIHGIRTDSRQVIKGDLFLALARDVEQARAHIHEAVSRGANAVIGDASVHHRPVMEEAGVVEIFLPELNVLMGEIAARFFQQPSREMTVIGITGTNGKTSVSHYIANFLSVQGMLTGVIGTLGYGIPTLDGEDLRETGYTTPDLVEVQRSLASLRDRGAKCVAMEVSSHGIEQSRVAGVQFTGAVFTNLSREHIDYHGSMENYGAAKRRLFQVSGLQFAVLNGDDPYSVDMASALSPEVKCVRYGEHESNDIRAEAACYDQGIAARVVAPQGAFDIRSELLGAFNLSNLLAVAGVALCLGCSLASLDGLGRLRAVTGRMQMLREPGCPTVVIDFAHTPDALEKVLLALRHHCRGKLVAVFGCGGDRDRGKRPQMAVLAERLADRIWVTSDNPRGESPEAIAADICAGFAHPETVSVQLDRAMAIRDAIGQSQPEDLVLVAGKGHETWQEVKGEKRYFSDLEQVRMVLQGLAKPVRAPDGADR
jgi:UDP-N-acetylmuramoyl-L-alanyl-D-glutamate--2,6-diaminopimelate ligase